MYNNNMYKINYFLINICISGMVIEDNGIGENLIVIRNEREEQVRRGRGCKIFLTTLCLFLTVFLIAASGLYLLVYCNKNPNEGICNIRPNLYLNLFNSISV